MSTLEERLESVYEVDVDEQISVRTWDGTDEPPTDLPQRFIVDDEDKADWALRKLARFRAEQEKNSDLAALQIERVTQWLTEQNGVLKEREAFFESLLVEFHQTLLAEDERRKTVRLPAGTLKARKTPDNVEISDDFLEFAVAERKDLVRTTHAIDRKAVKEAVLKDGEVIPGVIRIEGSTSFSIETERTSP